jgi:hypothetical protein
MASAEDSARSSWLREMPGAGPPFFASRPSGLPCCLAALGSRESKRSGSSSSAPMISSRKSAPEAEQTKFCRLRCLSACARFPAVAPEGAIRLFRGSEVGSDFCAGLGISLHWAGGSYWLGTDPSRRGWRRPGCPRSRSLDQFTGNASCSRLLLLLRVA